MNKMKIFALAGLLSASSWAAADLSYTNFGVGYVDGDFFDNDTDGFELRGSFALNSDFHLQASYDALDIDPGGTDLDILAFGGGWHTGIQQNLDFVATAAILDVDIGNSGTDGIRFTGGVRGMATDEIEFGAHFIYEDIDDLVNDDETGYELEGRFFFNRDTSFGVALRDVNNLETLRLDVRFDY